MTDTTGVAGRQESDLSPGMSGPAIGNNKISDNAHRDCAISVVINVVGRKGIQMGQNASHGRETASPYS
jgi:hypothetical protein